jgi:Leucine-rich repeat (LRR) protein
MSRRLLSLIIGTLLLPLGYGDSTGFLVLDLPIDLSPVLQPSDLVATTPSAPSTTFEDGNLTATVRSSLGLGSQEDLTCDLFSGLTMLDARNAGIVSLVGIQNLDFPSDLILDGNAIIDISPLSGLTSLTTLHLANNLITDISALSGLSTLTDLLLDDKPRPPVSAGQHGLGCR